MIDPELDVGERLAYIGKRFVDIRTAFMSLRSGLPGRRCQSDKRLKRNTARR